jgi:DNA replication protein DnaC
MTINITTQIKKFRLHFLSEHYEEFCVKAMIDPREAVQWWLLEEKGYQQRNRLQARLRQAKLGNFRPINEYKWDWCEKLDKVSLQKALQCDFFTEKSNLVFIGAEGLGKTMMAKNIAYQALLKEKSVLFITNAALTNDLDSHQRQGTFDKGLRKYLAPDLLIIDELGYLPSSADPAANLFQVISGRYEIGNSSIITTNLAFNDWNQCFQGAQCLTALIDRLLHRGEVVEFIGTSFRLHERKNRNLKEKIGKNERK